MIPLGVLASARVASGITCTYQTRMADTVDRATYTFSAVGIGAASSTRRVVVAVATRNGTGNPNPTITIGGVAATNDVTLAVDSNQQACTIASAVVPTGTTADIVVTLTATTGRCGVGVWTLSGGSPTGQTATGSGVTGVTLNVTTQVGDVVIGALGTRNDTGGGVTWGGATERIDANIEGVFYHSGADTVAAGTTTTLTTSPTTNDYATAVVAAAYR